MSRRNGFSCKNKFFPNKIYETPPKQKPIGTMNNTKRHQFRCTIARRFHVSNMLVCGADLFDSTQTSIECMSLACYSYTCDGRFSLLSILCTQCSPFKESESHIVERKNELHSQLQCYTFICNTSTRTHTTNIANNKKLSQNGKQQQLQKNVLE